MSEQQAAVSKESFFDVNARVIGDGKIEQSVEFVTEEEGKEIERESIMYQVLYTLESQTSESLISLGWTPPDGDKPIVADVAMLVDAIIGKGLDEKRRKIMVVHGLANANGWDRESLMMQKPRKLMAIYTDGAH
jgi:hypothetical protein